VSAYKRNSAIDAITMAGANLGVSIPVFVLGLLLAFVFAILLKGTPLALPPSGRLTPGIEIVPLATRWGLEGTQGPIRAIVDFISNIYTLNGLLSAQWGIFVDAFRHMILPAIALGTIPLAIIARITRSSLLDVLGQDYVRTARAKGLTERSVVRLHGLPNAMLPMVTVIGLQIGGLLSGAVLTETIFNLPGVGQATYDAITSHDFAVIEGFVLVIAVIFLVVNLIVDISYAYLDPRLRPS
jgi:peptide/nickel transport system permease protein